MSNVKTRLLSRDSLRRRPTLRYIALALRAGIQSGDACDRMFGEALSIALAVHLLREYGAAVLGAEEAVWWVAARKAGACGRIYSRSTGCRLNCFRDCSGGLHESLSLYQAVQRVYRPVALPVCGRGQGKKSERTSDHRQVDHQPSRTPCRFRRSEPSYPSFQKSFRLTSEEAAESQNASGLRASASVGF